MEDNLIKSMVFSLKRPGWSHISQFSAVALETLHSSQKYSKDRLFSSTEKKVSKKSQNYLSWTFPNKLQSNGAFWKIMNVLISETFSLSCSNRRITKTKFQTKKIFRTCLLSFFHIFNENVLLVPQLPCNVLHLIYCCWNFSIHNKFNAVIVRRNRLLLWPETLSSLINFPDLSGESLIRGATDIPIVPY